MHGRDLAAEVVRRAHSARRVRFDQRRTFPRLGDDVIDKHAPVDQIDPLALRSQRLPVPFELLWVGDERRYALLFEARLENLKFTPRDRKSTRLNSSHGYISYAVICLKQ